VEFEFRVNEHGFVFGKLEQTLLFAPPHPPNVEPSKAVAVSVTGEPEGYGEEQMPSVGTPSET